MADPYLTIDDAAAAALLAIGRDPNSKRKEILGAVIPVKGGFHYVLPENALKGARATSEARAEVPSNFAALVHNHPRGQSNDHFSAVDVSIAQKFGRPSYIAIAGTETNPILQETRRFDPRVSKTFRDRGLDREVRSHGEEFLAQIPLDMLPKKIGPMGGIASTEPMTREQMLAELITQSNP